MADHSRLTANLAAAGLLLAVGGGVLAWQRPWESTPSSVATSDAPSIPAEARSLLIQQFQELTDARSAAAFRSAAGRSAAAHRAADNIWAARRDLDVSNVAFDYRSGGEAADRTDGSTSAVVDVSWAGGSSTARFRLKPRSDGFDLMSVAGYGTKALPIWLAGRVSTAEASGVTAITIDGGEKGLDAATLAGAAVRSVRVVLPADSTRLTVVVPSTEAQAADVLGRSMRDVAQVAAASAVLGGTSGQPAIVVNPKLFADMDARARRVVMAHEATHVLSGIVGRDVELWVAEGFADFVALHDDRAPLSVSAGQILRSVKLHGAPKTLPTAKQFDESAHGLSTAYEAAWMVFRMLGEEFGDDAVRGFHADIVAGQSVEAAVQQRFGLTIGELTSRWRAYLTKSASTVS